MPTPTNTETEKEFIDRCMSQTVGEGKDKDQAYAICKSKWDNRNMKKQSKKLLDKIFAGSVSFDYDGVLSTEKGKDLAKRIRSTIYIVSARSSKDGMETTAKELGIPNSRIYATGSNKAKIEKIKELGITKHYDNNPDVIKELGSIGKLFN